MGQYRDGDHDADDPRFLKRQTDRDAVQDAVHAQHRGGETAAMRSVPVKRDEAVEREIE